MSERVAQGERVVTNYLAISGLYTLAASMIWGVNTLFLLDAGLNIQEVFFANAAFTAGTAIFEIPTGIVADTSGRRTSFLISLIILFITTWGYILVARYQASLAWFIVASVFMGLGYTFYSGAVEAWLVDALEFSKFQGSLDQVFARGAFVSGAAMLIGTVGGGLLGSLSLVWPYIIRSILLAAVFVLAFFSMHELGHQVRPLSRQSAGKEIRKVVRSSIRHGWNERPVRLLMIIAAIQASFFSWAFYAWQPYFLDLLGQPDAVWIAGIIAAAVALATMIGNGLVERLARLCARRTTLLIWAVIAQAAAATGLWLSNSFWGALPFLLLLMGATGVSHPVTQAYLHRLIPGQERATIISFNSMFSSAGGMIGQGTLGRIAQVRSIAAGYSSGGLFLLVSVPVLFVLRRLESAEDELVGAAGTKSACAAQGLPGVAAVDHSATTL